MVVSTISIGESAVSKEWLQGNRGEWRRTRWQQPVECLYIHPGQANTRRNRREKEYLWICSTEPPTSFTTRAIQSSCSRTQSRELAIGRRRRETRLSGDKLSVWRRNAPACFRREFGVSVNTSLSRLVARTKRLPTMHVAISLCEAGRRVGRRERIRQHTRSFKSSLRMKWSKALLSDDWNCGYRVDSAFWRNGEYISLKEWRVYLSEGMASSSQEWRVYLRNGEFISGMASISQEWQLPRSEEGTISFNWMRFTAWRHNQKIWKPTRTGDECWFSCIHWHKYKCSWNINISRQRIAVISGEDHCIGKLTYTIIVNIYRVNTKRKAIDIWYRGTTTESTSNCL